jgi:hypothetical protein
VLDARAICDTCGHTRDWHDRDAVRARLRTDPPIERPCYREVGGAACRCGGFRDSGAFALPAKSYGAGAPPTQARPLQTALLTVLLVLLGLALLYAYRSQTPAVPDVSVTQAIQDVNAGRVRAVTVIGNRATLELVDITRGKEQTTLPEPDTVLAPAITAYNAANPSKTISLTYQADSQPVTVIGAILLSLLPVFLIGGFFFYLMTRARRIV